MAESVAGDASSPAKHPDRPPHMRVGSSAADLEIVRVMSASLRSMPSEGITEIFKEIFEGDGAEDGDVHQQFRRNRISENHGVDVSASEGTVGSEAPSEDGTGEIVSVTTAQEVCPVDKDQNNGNDNDDDASRHSGDTASANVNDPSSEVAEPSKISGLNLEEPGATMVKLNSDAADNGAAASVGGDVGAGADRIVGDDDSVVIEESLGSPSDDGGENFNETGVSLMAISPKNTKSRAESMPVERLSRSGISSESASVPKVTSFRVTSLTKEASMKGVEGSMSRFSDEEISGAGATVSVAYGQTVVRAKVNPKFIRRRYSQVYHPDSIIHGIKAHDEYFWAPDSDDMSLINSDESISRDASSHDHHTKSEAKTFALMALSNMNIDSNTGEALPSWQVAKSVRPRSRSGSMQWVSKEFEEKLREFNETHTGSAGDPTDLDHSEKEFDADATDDVLSEKSRGDLASKNFGRVNRVMELSREGRKDSQESLAETSFTAETLTSPRPAPKRLLKAHAGNGGSPMRRPPPKSKSVEPPRVTSKPKKVRRRSIERLHQGNNIRCFRYHNVLQDMSGSVKASPRDVLESEKVKYNGQTRSPIRDLPKDVLGDYDAKAAEEKADNPNNVWKGVDIMRDTPSAILAFIKNKFPTKEGATTNSKRKKVSKVSSGRKKGVSPQPSVFVQDSISALNGVYKKSYPRSVNLVEAKTKNKILGVNFRKKYPVLPPIPPEINIGHVTGPAVEKEDSISSLADFLANAEGRALDSIPDKVASSASSASGKIKFTGDSKARLRELGFTPPSGNPGLFGLSELTGSDNDMNDAEQYEESEFENETPGQSEGAAERVAYDDDGEDSEDDGLVIYKSSTSYPNPNPNPCPLKEASFDPSRDVTLMF